MLVDKVERLLTKLENPNGVTLDAHDSRLLLSFFKAADAAAEPHIDCGYCFDNGELDGNVCEECCPHDFDDHMCMDCELEKEYPDYDDFRMDR